MYSSGELTRRIRSKAIAAFKSQNPGIPDSTIASFPSSTRTAQLVGQTDNLIRRPPICGSSNPIVYEDAGCCIKCDPVCPVELVFPNNFFDIDPENPEDPGTIDASGLEQFMTELLQIPYIPPPNESQIYPTILLFPEACNATSYTATVVDSSDNPLTYSQTYLGLFDIPFFWDGKTGIILRYASLSVVQNFGSKVFLTVSNSCSSQTTEPTLGCFIAGAQVTMADGSTKAIEDVAVGDMVRGAFGESNRVQALHRPLLGVGKLIQINGDHVTTTHHPHIGADRGFYLVNPELLTRGAYGKKHIVILADGTKTIAEMKGVNPDRLQTLTVGTTLQTVAGPRTVDTIEPYPASSMTQLYHLVVAGSHTFMVNGYAVVGWAREDDFDYDTWTRR
jgi:hypothetical protein